MHGFSITYFFMVEGMQYLYRISENLEKQVEKFVLEGGQIVICEREVTNDH